MEYGTSDLCDHFADVVDVFEPCSSILAAKAPFLAV